MPWITYNNIPSHAIYNIDKLVMTQQSIKTCFLKKTITITGKQIQHVPSCTPKARGKCCDISWCVWWHMSTVSKQSMVDCCVWQRAVAGSESINDNTTCIPWWLLSSCLLDIFKGLYHDVANGITKGACGPLLMHTDKTKTKEKEAEEQMRLWMQDTATETRMAMLDSDDVRKYLIFLLWKPWAVVAWLKKSSWFTWITLLLPYP